MLADVLYVQSGGDVCRIWQRPNPPAVFSLRDLVAIDAGSTHGASVRERRNFTP